MEEVYKVFNKALSAKNVSFKNVAKKNKERSERGCRSTS